MQEKNDPAYWEKILTAEGMPAKLKNENLGQRVPIGLGVKSEKEEKLEDRGGHSRICPLKLGRALTDNLDQVNDRPVEETVQKHLDEEEQEKNQE